MSTGRWRPRIAGTLALGAAAMQWGCASRLEAPRGPAGAVVNPERGSRGNPPFYDIDGKRYFVRASSAGYDERGIASWYGPDFQKQTTSSGETYNMYGMTAAHKTLPLPTWVEVTNLANHRRVIVKVNDRGPFVKNRIIDLSYSAAKALDMIRDGTAPVEVRALGAPREPAPVPVGPVPVLASAAEPPSVGAAAVEPAAAPAREPARPLVPAGPAAPPGPAAGRSAPRRSFALIASAAADEPTDLDRLEAAAASSAPPARPPHLFVQVGAFTDRANAQRLVDRLEAEGYRNALIVDPGDGLERVRVGPLADAAEYDRVTAGLRRLGLTDARLVTAPDASAAAAFGSSSPDASALGGGLGVRAVSGPP